MFFSRQQGPTMFSVVSPEFGANSHACEISQSRGKCDRMVAKWAKICARLVFPSSIDTTQIYI